MLLIARAAEHAYAIRRADLLEIRLVASGQSLNTDQHGRPCEQVELATLFAYSATPARQRRALIVPLRRRLVALLVDEIEAVEVATSPSPLPELLRTRLNPPWSVGALLLGDELIVQIDVRAIAMSYVANRASFATPSPATGEEVKR